MEIEFLKEQLKAKLSSKRYKHSIRVMETAIILAKFYNEDSKKVSIAAVLHDYAKEMNKNELVDICKTFFYDETKDFITDIQLLHGFVSAYYAKEMFNITDEDILNAIKYHTTGRRNMSLLEKIVYMADAIEPEREYPHVNEIRDLAFVNLDKALLFEVNHKLKYYNILLQYLTLF